MRTTSIARSRPARGGCKSQARRSSSRASRGRPTSRSAARPRSSRRRALRGRAPHGRLEQLHAGRVGGDRARHRDLPREGNGWNDIGYNFLVDKYGQVFEGRYGGVDKAVIGAHAEGFNTGSFGVAVLGSYGTSKLTAAAKASLEQLLAWKLDLAHIDPLSTLTWKSGGNPRFASGVPVLLRAISGHRDTGFTDCPGNALVRAVAADREGRRGARRPEDLRALARGTRGPGSLHREAVGAARRGRSRSSTPPGRRSRRAPAAARRRLDVGRSRRAARQVHVDDRRRAHAPRPEPSARSGARAAEGDGVARRGRARPRRRRSPTRSPLAATVTATLVDPAGQTLSTLFTAQKAGRRTDARVHAAAGCSNGRTRSRSARPPGTDGHDSCLFVVDDILVGLRRRRRR